jgi:BA14K-like protein
MQRDSETFRLRTLAAAAILFAGLTLGFLLGRMSAWLAAVEAPKAVEVPKPATVSRGSTELGPSETVREKSTAITPPSAPTRNTTTAPAGIQPKATLKLLPPVTSAPSSAASHSGEPAPDGPSPATQEPPKPVVAPNWRAAGDPASSASANDEANSPLPNVTLINPGQEDARAAAAEPAAKSEAGMAEFEAADRQGIAACERRYSSFRRNDGTYQPFGGGPRQRCPLLR